VQNTRVELVDQREAAMADQIRVDPAALEQPARRFQVGADGTAQIRQAMQAALHAAGQGAGNNVVAAAADTFGQATGSVLDALGSECRLMSAKLTGAGVRYRVTDESAVVVHVIDTDLSVPTGR
jgi:uncharacterized protein YukE